METNTDIRNDELKVSIITLKLQNDEESINEFKRCFRNGYFIIPIMNDDNNEQVTFMLLSDQKENNYFQVYTDMDEYKKWFDYENSKTVILNYDELSNILITSTDEVTGITINPFSENIILDKNFIKDTYYENKILITENDNIPTKLKNTIKKVLNNYKEIKESFLFNIKKNNLEGYLLVIDSNTKNKDKLFDKVGKEILDNVKELNIDIISSKDEIIKDIITKKEPFYKK